MSIFASLRRFSVLLGLGAIGGGVAAGPFADDSLQFSQKIEGTVSGFADLRRDGWGRPRGRFSHAF
jgi:hypothetical protein